MDIIRDLSPKSLIKETTFYNNLLSVYAHYKLPILYGMEKITTEEVMDKLDMFQARFGKLGEFGW